MLSPDSDVQYVKGVGPRRAELLGRLEIRTALDLIMHFPARYEDRGNLKPISEARIGESETFKGIIRSSKGIFIPRRRRKIFEATVGDDTGYIVCHWYQYNDKYFSKKFEVGKSVIVSGKVTLDKYRGVKQIVHPDVEFLGDDASADDAQPEQAYPGGIYPVYPLTEGLNQKILRGIISGALASIGRIRERLPESLIAKYKLPGLDESIRILHRPGKDIPLEKLESFQSKFHKRLIFDEFFVLELALAMRRAKLKKEKTEYSINLGNDDIARLISHAPFKLTGAQTRVLGEIFTDIARDVPMNRLLQGDVGSGKTIVAAIALMAAVGAGYQGAVMAPTEILAEQHFNNISRLVEPFGVTIQLLSSATKKKKKVIEQIESGETKIAVGTHALIRDDVKFKNMAIAVIDEQHRFGVLQREAIMKKGENIHTLIMTATPIPRTLSMTVYGDLDVSVIDEMPKGRKPVETKLYFESKRPAAYRLIHDQIKMGRQVFMVYPLVEESEAKSTLKDATTMFEHLKTDVFRDSRLGLLHGKMKHAEKEAVMAAFSARELDLLVATTVVEVGIDVPNATVIVIEHAEMFGLAQLHQLRGRVGRSEHESYCILLASHAVTEIGRKRLEAMVSTTDGFKIAEYDLRLRGSGDFFGTRQTGFPELKLGNLVRDWRILKAARTEAFEIVKDDPNLDTPEYGVLKESLKADWLARLRLADIG